MQVSIEEINGKQRTVIRKDFDPEWVKEQLSMGNTVIAECRGNRGELTYALRLENMIIFTGTMKDTRISWCGSLIEYIITILPPLPKHPKPEDACRLYEYMAEGLDIFVKGDFDDVSRGNILMLLAYGVLEGKEIIHAAHNGERVEIAIKGES